MAENLKKIIKVAMIGIISSSSQEEGQVGCQRMGKGNQDDERCHDSAVKSSFVLSVDHWLPRIPGNRGQLY